MLGEDERWIALERGVVCLNRLLPALLRLESGRALSDRDEASCGESRVGAPQTLCGFRSVGTVGASLLESGARVPDTAGTERGEARTDSLGVIVVAERDAGACQP